MLCCTRVDKNPSYLNCGICARAYSVLKDLDNIIWLAITPVTVTFITFSHCLVTFWDLGLKEKRVLNESHATYHLAGRPRSYATRISWEHFTEQHPSLTRQRETSLSYLADVACDKFFFERTLRVLFASLTSLVYRIHFRCNQYRQICIKNLWTTA